MAGGHSCAGVALVVLVLVVVLVWLSMRVSILVDLLLHGCVLLVVCIHISTCCSSVGWLVGWL